MKKEHIKYLACPECGAELRLKSVHAGEADRVESGALQCAGCGLIYSITGHIPRFVPQDNYAQGFGLEWSRHARTQYDSYSGHPVSEKRFFEETRWDRNLRGQLILEAGSGSGRFTEQAASTGAMVVSFDYSCAVDANYASNGARDNVLIVQADIYKMPFRQHFFDKVFCFGVLQHTPDPEKAFKELPRYVKPGGDIAVDVYLKRGFFKQLITTKYLVRPLTKRIAPETLYRLTTAYVKFMWPLARAIRRFPYGRNLSWMLLIADHGGVLDLDDAMLREWAILDTFDMLSPAYDYPQTLETIQRWFTEAGLRAIDVRHGYNGIEGRAKAP